MQDQARQSGALLYQIADAIAPLDAPPASPTAPAAAAPPASAPAALAAASGAATSAAAAPAPPASLAAAAPGGAHPAGSGPPMPPPPLSPSAPSERMLQRDSARDLLSVLAHGNAETMAVVVAILPPALFRQAAYACGGRPLHPLQEAQAASAAEAASKYNAELSEGKAQQAQSGDKQQPQVSPAVHVYGRACARDALHRTEPCGRLGHTLGYHTMECDHGAPHAEEDEEHPCEFTSHLVGAGGEPLVAAVLFHEGERASLSFSRAHVHQGFPWCWPVSELTGACFVCTCSSVSRATPARRRPRSHPLASRCPRRPTTCCFRSFPVRPARGCWMASRAGGGDGLLEGGGGRRTFCVDFARWFAMIAYSHRGGWRFVCTWRWWERACV